MIDLTNITTPFGLLDEETQAALKAHKGPIEFYYGQRGWVRTIQVSWIPEFTYRAANVPREFWINCYPGEDHHVHTSLVSAREGKTDGYGRIDPNAQTIHVREVIEE